MALTLREAQSLAKKLEEKLAERAKCMKVWNDYYAGKQNLAFASDRFKAAFGGMFTEFADNWCLPTGSPVIVADGVVAIDRIAVGETVLTHDGHLRRVTRVLRRPVDEQIVVFRTFGSPQVRMTGQHPVYATKSGWLTPTKRRFGDRGQFSLHGLGSGNAFVRNQVPRKWILASELEPGDVVWHSTTRPSTADVKPNLLALLGWYLAEGSVSDNGRIAISLRGDRMDDRAEVEWLMLDVLGKQPSVVEGRGNDVQIVVYSKDWARTLQELGGRGAAGKRIAADIMTEPLTGLLRTAWLGDGTRPHSGITQLAYKTTSLSLAVQIHALLLREGVTAGWTTSKQAGRHDAFGLTVSGDDAVRLADLLDEAPLRERQYRKAPIGCIVDGWVGYAVADVDRERYTGDVWDLTVEGAHSFVLPGMISVHNCEVVADAPPERLEVLGFRFADSSDGEMPQTNDQAARDIWQRNGLDSESKVGHLEGMVKSRFFTLTWVDDPQSRDPQADITIEDPTQVIVAYQAGSRRKRAAALKVWDGEDGWCYSTLYLPDELWKFRRAAASSTSGIILPPGVSIHDWAPRFTDESEYRIDNPLGKVPIVEFTNRRRLVDDPSPEHKTAMPLQNAVNKLVADMMVAAEAGAFPARWGTGIDVPKDPITGEEITDSDMWRAALSKMMRATAPEARFGNFAAADLSNFVAGVEMLIMHIAAQSRTPPHYLLGKMANLSGEALAAAETGLVSKCHDKTVFLGESWEETMRLAFAVTDDPRADVHNAETIWADVEHITIAARADAALKKKQAGVPWRQRMEDMGYTQTQIDRMRTWLEEDAQLANTGLLDAPAGDGGAPTGDSTTQ